MDFTSLIENLQQPREVELHGETVLLLPPGWSAEDQNGRLDAPKAIKASPRFLKPESLVQYANHFQTNDGCRIFANSDENEIVVQLDPHQRDVPSWEHHTASLKFQLSSEWRKWANISGQWIAPEDFRTFLENNLEYVVGDFSGADVLTMCRNIRVRRRGSMSFETKGQDADRSIVIGEDSEAGGIVNGEETRFPEILQARLRVFKSCEAFEFEVRLRVTSQGNQLMFMIDLMDEEGIVERAFDHELAQFKDLMGEPAVTVLYGKPSTGR